MLGPWRESGSMRLPAGGPVSWTSREDEAEAAAIILAHSGLFDGTVTLTAATAPTFEEIAEIAAEVTDSAVSFTTVDDEDWVAFKVKHGTPESIARFMLNVFQGARDNYFAETTPTLSELLAREPRSVTSFIRDPKGFDQSSATFEQEARNV